MHYDYPFKLRGPEGPIRIIAQEIVIKVFAQAKKECANYHQYDIAADVILDNASCSNS